MIELLKRLFVWLFGTVRQREFRRLTRQQPKAQRKYAKAAHAIERARNKRSAAKDRMIQIDRRISQIVRDRKRGQ